MDWIDVTWEKLYVCDLAKSEVDVNASVKGTIEAINVYKYAKIVAKLDKWGIVVLPRVCMGEGSLRSLQGFFA